MHPAFRALVAGLLFLAPGQLRAQDTPPAIAAAERLQDQGSYERAAEVLLGYLRTHPDDAGIRWRAAQLLQSAGRTDAAIEQYGHAVSLDPAEPWLRLEYADLLVASERFDEARSVVGPVARTGEPPREARLQALTLLGTLAWWRGDLSTAVERFEAVLAMDPGREAAARPLGQIRAFTRPWLRLELGGIDDNQPYRRGRAVVEAGVFLDPLWRLRLEVTPAALDPPPLDPTASTTGDLRTTGRVLAEVSGFLPDARLELTFGAGGLLQGESSEWLGVASLGVRLGGGVRLRGRAERERYLWTAESADTLLMVERLEVALDRAAHPGWAGQLVYRHESFPDGNPVRTAFGWILAPLASNLRLGGALSWQDSDESRWSQEVGRYSPYFTPEEQRVVSALAEVAIPLGSATARINGRWGVWARERTPNATPDTSSTGPRVTPPVGTGAPTLSFVERAYTPWSVRLTLDAPLGGDTSLRLEAERETTAFYELNRALVSLRIPFGRGR